MYLSVKCYQTFFFLQNNALIKYMLYVKRKFKSVTIDLTQYIHILFVLNLIFESLLVPDILKFFPSRYPTLIKYVDIK